MFLPLSKVLDNNQLICNYKTIKDDYLNFLNKNYFVDYSHEYNLVVDDITTLSMPPQTGHFWQVCPLIISGQVIQGLPSDIKSCFTTNLLMSFDIKPVLAVFSMLEPHSEVEPHLDTDAMIMHNHYDVDYLKNAQVVKYHYSLDVPPGDKCGLKVLDETRILKNGDLNPFVENSVHSAFNRSNLRRGALIVSYLEDTIYP